MNDQRIIISLSRRFITLEYSLGDTQASIEKFPRGEWPAPLAIYESPSGFVLGEEALNAARCGNSRAYTDYFSLLRAGARFNYSGMDLPAGELLVRGLEPVLQTFLRGAFFGNGRNLDEIKGDLPVMVVCEADIDNHERILLERLFVDKGYSTLHVLPYDEIIGDWLGRTFPQPVSVDVWGDGTDIYFTLYRRGTSRPAARRKASGNLGRDPRVEVICDNIWEESIKLKAWGLEKENEMPRLREEAVRFLNSGDAECEGSVTLSDGYSYDYYVNRANIDSLTNELSGSRTLARELSNFLEENECGRKDNIRLVLRGAAAGNDYVRNQLKTGFGAVTEVDRETWADIRSGLPGIPIQKKEVKPKGGDNPEPPSSTTDTPAQRLVCRAENVVLELKDGALIGRVEGPYASRLSGLKYISARHAVITRSGDHWIITDVGSRNGTAVNGKWCYTPLPFRKGDTVRIGNFYDFIAE